MLGVILYPKKRVPELLLRRKVACTTFALVGISNNDRIAVNTNIVGPLGQEAGLDNHMRRIDSRDVPRALSIVTNARIDSDIFVLPGIKSGYRSVFDTGSQKKISPPNPFVADNPAVIIKEIEEQ